MGNLLGQLISVEKFKGKKDGSDWYVLKVLATNDKISKSFFKDEDLYNQFKEIPKLTDIEISYELVLRDDGLYNIKPLSVQF